LQTAIFSGGRPVARREVGFGLEELDLRERAAGFLGAAPQHGQPIVAVDGRRVVRRDHRAPTASRATPA